MATQFEKDCALMAGVAYRSTRNEINRLPIPTESGWNELTNFYRKTDSSGFEAVTFQRGNEIIISFAGTYDKDMAGDVASDAALGLGESSPQLREAALYYCQVYSQAKAANPNATITLTGHSLGGGLASLIGVFFDVRAVTFDQAPFSKAALNPLVKNDILTYLLDNGISGDILAKLNMYNADASGLDSRDGNVTYQSVQGEFLSFLTNHIGIAKSDLTHGTSDAGMFNLHSMALLTAFLENDDFRQITTKLPDLLRMVFDDKLYSFPTDKSDENFIDRLVRHESGTAPGAVDSDMLTRFTSDLNKIAQDGGLTMTNNNLTKRLVAFAMQAYYTDRLAAGKELFGTEGVSGGIRFNLNDVADTLQEAKGWTNYLVDWPLSVQGAEASKILAELPDLKDWFLQAGDQPLTATAGAQRAFMVGGTGNDTLAGGNQADVLLGGGGRDTLTGGGGNDILVGGAGIDTYVINDGDGRDTIIDEGKNNLIVNGKLIAGAFIRVEGTNRYEFTSDDRTYTMAFNSPGTLTIDGSTSLTFANQTSAAAFADGDFGITLYDTPEAERTLTGDGADDVMGLYFDNNTKYLYFSGAISGSCSYFQDTLGADYWRFPLSFDSPPAFLITGDGGADRLFGLKGEDELNGGDGNDVLVGDLDHVYDQNQKITLPGTGSRDLLRGDAGRDLLLGWEGDDLLYGGEDDDFLSGEQDDDALDGGSGSDLLAGGDGNDQLAGGGGNDVLIGDAWLGLGEDDAGLAWFSAGFASWDIGPAYDAQGRISSITPQGFSLTDALTPGNDALAGGEGNDFLLGGGGSDILHGEDGNDWLEGGEGDDYLDGGSNNDQVQGGSGNDTLVGGGGDDLLAGQGDADVLYGGDGSDQLQGGAGNDSLRADAGNDSLFGNTGNDLLEGGEGNDYLDGGDIVMAGKGRDWLDGDLNAGDDYHAQWRLAA